MKGRINIAIIVVVSGVLALHGFGAVATGSPTASDPTPPDGATGVISPLLQWTSGKTAAFHDVYLGTNPTPGAAEYKGRQPLAWSMYFHMAGWTPGTTYYWRIDEVEADGTTIHTGDVWSFTAALLTAYNPDPPDGAEGVVFPLLQWQSGETAKWHDVYLGTNPTPGAAEYKARQPLIFPVWFEVGGWIPGETYYWRIDEVEADGTTIHTGDVWSFTAARLTAHNPDPSDGAEHVAADSDLSWSKGSTAVTHDVYFGTDATAVANGTGGTFKGNQSDTTYDPGILAMGTTCYWRIDEVESDGTTKHTGTVWSFTTIFPSLVELEITGPDQVFEQSSAQYNAVAYYDDGSTKDVTAEAIWSVYPPACASIDESGLLKTKDVDEVEVIAIYAAYSEGGITIHAQKAVWCVPIVVDVEILYVDADAVGNNDGSTWADAYNFLQDALAAAECDNEIWVAEGIYRPDEDTGNPDGTGDRTATFQLRSCVAIYGGYAGFGEPVPDARDVRSYETVLSGDLNGDDGPEEWENCGENSYHVVTGSGTDSTAVLDGFTITAGNASGTVPHVWDPEDNGAGMYNDSGDPTVTNCTFAGNQALGDGAGMYNRESSPILTNCIFRRNSARQGGGICCMHSSNPTLTNCVFNGSTASDAGGAVYCHYSSSPTMTNCTIWANSANYGGGIYCRDCSPTIVNTILWDDSPDEIDPFDSPITVTYCDVQGGWPGPGNINSDPLFVDANGADNVVGTEDDNLRLLTGSACIDAGDNSAIPPSVVVDLDSNPRIVDGNSDGNAVVDMGAYENMVMLVETCYAVNVGMTGATLCGGIVYDGGEACQYRFRYCMEGDADSFTPWSLDFKAAGESFSQDVNGLTPSSRYYFFAQIRNSTGESAGGLESLTTLGGLLQLEAPHGGTYAAGERCLICWKADPTLLGRDVLLEYSTDNGVSWDTIGMVANGDDWRSYKGGHYLWQAPAVTSDECLVRISDASDPSIFDVSASKFSIVAQGVPDVVGLGQADAEATITGAGLVVGTIEYEYDNAAPAGEVMGQYPAAGAPAAPGSAVDLVVSAGPLAAGPPTVDTEYATSIGTSSATLEGIITDDGGGACQYRFHYCKEGGPDNFTPWSSDFKTAGQSFSQDISGLDPGSKYYFRAEAKNSAGDGAGRRRNFVTLDSLLQLEGPNGGFYRAGSRCLISWKADPTLGASDVLVEYSTNNGGSWNTIGTVANGDEWRGYKGGHYSWEIPAVSSNACLVRISDTSDPSIFDVSDSTFTIVP